MNSFDPKAWLWFLSSYAPLWVMLGVRFDPLWLRVGLIIFGVACAGGVVFLVGRRNDERASNTTITITGDAGTEVSGYLAAYLLPFLTVDDPQIDDGVAYLIFLLVAGVIYVRSGLMQINPTVYLMNRRVLKATVPAGDGKKEVFVISGRDLRTGESLKGERFSDRLFIDHKDG